MSQAVERDAAAAPLLALAQWYSPRRWLDLAPLLLTAASATAFLIVQPGVNDLWAARARQDAHAHGVGLSYWFSWFGGGSTPGSYSVLSPYLSSAVTVVGLLAISAVVIVALSTVLLRSTPHRLAATYLVAVTTSINVWQGHVPFVLGCAFGVGALLAARHGQRALTGLLAVATLLSSPVSGAFLGLALVAALLARPNSKHPAWLPIGLLLAGGATILVVFGSPGPEPITVGMTFGMCALLLAFLTVRPGRAVSVTVYLSIALVVAMAFIPNGMGSNFARFVWFCLPVAVIAQAGGRRALIATLAVVTVGIGSVGLVSDLRGASQAAAKTDYYAGLGAQLDTLPDLAQYRLEVADDGTHTASYALLGHATLARGFETQTDMRYNPELREGDLTAAQYRSWLDDNSVGYVAANLNPPKPTAETRLVLDHQPSYLQRIWSDADWALYRVASPTPIVAAPASLVSIDQAKLIVDIPCACTVTVRTRWSSLLTAALADDTEREYGDDASVAADRDGWTLLTTTEPGRYVLEGR